MAVGEWMDNGLQLTFDYTALDVETRIVVQQRTEEIRVLVRRSAQDIIDIGAKLIDVKARLGHGNFGPWLEAEFGWGQDTAGRFMNVSQRFGQIPQFAEFAPSALYLLAAPSTPEPARLEAIERASNGESITYTTAKAIDNEYRAAPAADTFNEYRAEVTLPVVVAPEVLPSWAADDDETPMTYTVEDRWGGVETVTVAPDEELTVIKRPHVANNSGNNEWYTPREYIDAALRVLGWIDVDPASNELANQVVGAKRYYTAEDDGLCHRWDGRVWMNPPYAAGLVDRFCAKYAEHVLCGDIQQGIVLVNNATETRWFASLVAAGNAVVFPHSRVKFWAPDGTGAAPLQGQAIVYSGPNVDLFLTEFGSFGWGARL